MMAIEHYNIGTHGVPWGVTEKKQWLNQQTVKRSYRELVVRQIEAIGQHLAEQVLVEQYGALSYDSDKYPLFALRSKYWQTDNPAILITGGVHGYETSGVLGALRFIQNELARFSKSYNFVIVPCVSPWGFETINRWNPDTVDPNRSFFIDGDVHIKGVAEESALLMSYVDSLKLSFLAHIDLHETTDTDNSEFRPALAARDAVEQKSWDIPDGFYTVGDSSRPVPAFQTAIVDAVEKITHIAPADGNGALIGDKIEQRGVINYAKKELGLCGGFTDARFVSTTEVYPDSPQVDDENCVLAQVAAVTGALGFLSLGSLV